LKADILLVHKFGNFYFYEDVIFGNIVVVVIKLLRLFSSLVIAFLIIGSSFAMMDVTKQNPSFLECMF
jgi:hypothetical protein